jgi:hypothetical protein
MIIFDNIKKEFKVNEKGESFCSRRAIARMTGKRLYTIQNLLQLTADQKQPHKMFETFSGISFEGDQFIPDTLASLIIQYYAFKGSETAQNYLSAFVAIGLRTAIQQTTGWNKPKKEYGNLLLAVPREWTKVFADEFYDELSRLTGLNWDKKTHKKPCIFAQHTHDLIYAYLPKEVYELIKSHQKEHGGYIHKMHQFLNKDGMECLIAHLEMTLNILNAVSNLQDAKLLIHQATNRVYQQSLFTIN